MRKIALSFALVGACAVPVLFSAPAHAQATRTWVSGVGDDTFPCSRTAPCKTFAGAFGKTAATGEINCLDPAGYGAVTISKSMTIDCAGTNGHILATNSNGIVINNEVGIKVVLRNLQINGTQGSGAGPGFNGIRFVTSGSLHLDNVLVQSFSANMNGFGLDFRPNGTARLEVSNSRFENNGNAATGAGIHIRPTAGGTTAVISKSVVNRGLQGIVADGTGGGTINVTVHDSVVSGNINSGVLATSAGTGVGVLVDRSAISNNGTGLNATGNANATIRVGSSTIAGNGTATAAVSGQVLSYLNNFINANGVDTTPPGVPGGVH